MPSLITLSAICEDLLSILAPYRYEFALRVSKTSDMEALIDFFALGRYGNTSALPAALLQQQWQLREQTYKQQYPNHLTLIVLYADKAAGMVTLTDNVCSLHILELVLLPQFRSRGWGSALLRGLQVTAALRAQIISLHVLPHNPALSLYQRLGFVERGSEGMQLLLEWTPQKLHNASN